MPDEKKTEEPQEEEQEEKKETPPATQTVPVYVERHELTSALEEFKKLLNDKSKADEDRYAALETRLTTPKPAEHKPEGETQDGTTKVSTKKEKPSGGDKPRTARRRLWHNPFDRA